VDRVSNQTTESDPLERIIVDKDDINHDRLADALENVLSVDRETGDIVTREGYQDLDNNAKFVARLLARRAALEKDIIETSELGESASGFADRMGPTESTIKNYGSLDFVDNDESHGGYYIKGYAIGQAINFLNEATDDGDE